MKQLELTLKTREQWAETDRVNAIMASMRRPSIFAPLLIGVPPSLLFTGSYVTHTTAV